VRGHFLWHLRLCYGASERSPYRLLILVVAASKKLSLREAEKLAAGGDEGHEQWIANTMTRYFYPSKRALFKMMRSVTVESVSSEIRFMPSHQARLEYWNGDGIDKAHHVVISVASSASAIGTALRLALARCT